MIYYLIYKRYPCQGCFDFESIVKTIEKKEISFGLPNGNKEYQPYIDLARMLLDANEEPKTNARRKNQEMYWNEFMTNKCVQNSLKAVEKAFESNFGKKEVNGVLVQGRNSFK